MKRVLLIGMPVLLGLMLAGCNGLKEVDKRLDEHEERIAALEDRVAELNGQLATLQELLGGKYFVSQVVDLADGSGYKLTLVDAEGRSVEKVVHNGQDGAEPVVGVRMDTDGNWYWTVDGDWLLADGAKVRADGKDGKDGKDGADGATPQVKVENGKWYVSYDGSTWTYAGEAVTEAKSLVASIDAVSDPYNVIFTLSDGSVFTVPKSASAVKLQLVMDTEPFAAITEGESVSAAYEVIVPQGVTYTFMTYEPEGWTVVVSPAGGNKGTVTVRIPEGASSGKVLFVLNGSDGSSFVRVVEVGVRLKEEYTVDSAAGTLLIDGAEDLTLLDEADWLQISGNTVTIQENTAYDSRTATLSYIDAEGRTHIVVIVQAQKDAIVLTASEIEADPDGGEIPLVVRANVDIKASSDAAWLTVTPATKGLTDRPYTLLVEANASGARRSARVTFAADGLTQGITVTQEAKSVAPTPSGVFTLVTDASTLAAGDRLLVVSADGQYAMGADQGNYRAAETVTVSDDTITDPADAIQVVTLEGAAGSWNLAVDGGYLAAQSASKNYLKTLSSVTDYARWSISIDGGAATLKAAAGSRALLGYNNTSASRRFSCYSSTGTSVTLVALYREETSYTPSEDPILAQEAMGCYLTGGTRTYVRGADQVVRANDGTTFTFAILEPETAEQMVVSGTAASFSVGDAVPVSLDWRKGLSTVLTGNYRMHVAQVKGDKVWLGNGRGQGFIIQQ